MPECDCCGYDLPSNGLAPPLGARFGIAWCQSCLAAYRPCIRCSVAHPPDELVGGACSICGESELFKGWGDSLGA